MGGWDQNDNLLSSTESLKYVNQKWEISFGSNLPEPVCWSAALASRSNHIVGYLVGGFGRDGITTKIWSLRRWDMKYVEIKKRLQIPRYGHTVLNLRSTEILGCQLLH